MIDTMRTDTAHDQVAVSSGGATLEEGIELAARLGASSVELACQHPANRPSVFGDDRAAAVRRRMSELGLAPIVHTDSAVNTAESVPVLREAVYAHFVEYLDLCGRLGSDRMIVHAGLTFSDDDAADVSAAVDMLGRWAEAAERAGVLLLLENMNVLPRAAEIRYLGCTGEDVAEIIGRVGSPALRACADLGHAHLLPGGVPRFLREVEGMVAHVQLTDNDGVDDDHLALGRGTVDLPVVLSELDRQGYRGPIAIELDGEAERITSVDVLRQALDVRAGGGAEATAPAIRPVDVRDLTQEDHTPVYRVWLPRRADASRVSVLEFTDATLDEVDAWAQANADFGYSLAVVHPVADGLEAIWLRGSDPNDLTS